MYSIYQFKRMAITLLYTIVHNVIDILYIYVKNPNICKGGCSFYNEQDTFLMS